MKARKSYLSAVLIALIAILAPATLVWGGGDPPLPPDWSKVTGPEIWGTAVVHCSSDPAKTNFVAIRVKRIKDCDVLTDALVEYPLTLAACPDNSGPFLYERMLPGSLFAGDPDIPAESEPIVTKIKNFKVHNRDATGANADLSFDAQIKFLAP